MSTSLSLSLSLSLATKDPFKSEIDRRQKENREDQNDDSSNIWSLFSRRQGANTDVSTREYRNGQTSFRETKTHTDRQQTTSKLKDTDVQSKSPQYYDLWIGDVEIQYGVWVKRVDDQRNNREDPVSRGFTKVVDV